MKLKRVNVQLFDHQIAALKELGAATNMSMSQIVRTAIDRDMHEIQKATRNAQRRKGDYQ